MSDFDDPENDLQFADGIDVATKSHDGSADFSGNPTETPPEKLRDQDLDETNVEDALRVNGGATINMLIGLASLGTVIPGGPALLSLMDTQVRVHDVNDDFSMSNLSADLREYFLYLQGDVDSDGHEIKKDDEETLADAMEEGEEVRQRQREMDAWMKSEHSYAGIEMTGAEWGEFADELKNDTPLHQWLVDQIKKKENKTDAEAQTEAARIALLAKMQSVPKDQWTDEMKSLDQYLTENPAERTKYNGYIDRADSERKGLTLAPTNVLQTTATNSTQDNSIATQADSLTAKPFPGAPNASADFQAAASPPAVDDKAPDPAKPAPQIAVASPPPPMPGGNGGFDMS